jgi:phosphoglycolate phosphatase
MNHLALFDCDGTLVDSQAGICLAMEAAFTEAGLEPPTRSATRQVVGLSLFEIMRTLLPSAEEGVHRDMAERYRAAFLKLRGDGMVDEPLYSGIKELIFSLYQGGWKLGVATGKSDRGLTRCLDHHAIRSQFVTLQTADSHPSKPHPSMVVQAMADAGSDAATTIMIGDTGYDINMGIAAGCRTIGVAWGYHTAEELIACGAHTVVHSISELAQVLEDMR